MLHSSVGLYLRYYSDRIDFQFEHIFVSYAGQKSFRKIANISQNHEVRDSFQQWYILHNNSYMGYRCDELLYWLQ